MLGLYAVTLAAASSTHCPLFGHGQYYATPVVRAAVDRNSDKYIASMMQAGNNGGFWMAADPVEYINVASPSTPLRPVHPKVSYHRFDRPYPWGQGFRIEPLSDAHAIVLAPDSCELYETYDTSFAGNDLSAYSGAHWNLRRAFEPLPPGTPSAMASGLSLYAGMVRWEDVAAGSIDHALNWAAPAGTLSQWEYVRPASDAEGIPFKGPGAYRLPYGALLRLRASFDTSRFGPQAKAIARAMKEYGIYAADTAHENELYNAMPESGPDPWSAADLAALRSIHISDFEVLALGPVRRVPGR